MNHDVISYYDFLIEEGQDPVQDPPILQTYMDKWDGEYFINLLELDDTKNVLEIGCGTGRLAVKIAPKVHSFCGIDISPKTLETAKIHLRDKNVKLICDDFLTHQFKEKFNLVYSSLTFMHMENKHQAIKMMAEILMKNGIVVLSLDKNQDDILNYGVKQLKIYPDDPDVIIGMLKEQGFYEIEKHEVEFAYLIKAKRM